jgi:hypothetical protein
MDIGSLETGLNGHWLGSWFGRKVLRKTWGSPSNCFRCTHFSMVDYVALALLNVTTRLPFPIYPLPLTLLALPVSSLLYHSLGHDIRLGIPSPVHTFPAPLLHSLGHDTRLAITSPVDTLVASPPYNLT